MSDRSFLMLLNAYRCVRSAVATDGAIDAAAALAFIGQLELQSADWLRLVSFARVTAVTRGMEHAEPTDTAGPYIPLDHGFFDDATSIATSGTLPDAEYAVARLRAIPLSSAGWGRLVMFAAVMEAIGAQEAQPL